MRFRRFFLAPIRAYQYVSALIPGKCRYYPTCSEYAAWQFTFNAPHKALLASALRIARCNQLFPGGIDYPQVLYRPNISILSPELNRCYGKITMIYWLIPSPKEGYYYVVKDFDADRHDNRSA